MARGTRSWPRRARVGARRRRRPPRPGRRSTRRASPRCLQTAGMPGPRPDHPHLGRAAAVELPALAGGLCRVRLPGRALARLRRASTWRRRIAEFRRRERRYGGTVLSRRPRPPPATRGQALARPAQARRSRPLVLAPAALACIWLGAEPWTLLIAIARARCWPGNGCICAACARGVLPGMAVPVAVLAAGVAGGGGASARGAGRCWLGWRARLVARGACAGRTGRAAGRLAGGGRALYRPRRHRADRAAPRQRRPGAPTCCSCSWWSGRRDIGAYMAGRAVRRAEARAGGLAQQDLVGRGGRAGRGGAGGRGRGGGAGPRAGFPRGGGRGHAGRSWRRRATCSKAGSSGAST